MRFLHTADWHIGKKLAGFDLIEDQRAVFEQVKQIARDQAVDAIVVAGDLYDRALPSEAAVTTVNEMLVELNRDLALPVLAISGNHDSAVRLATGREWYQATQLYLNTQLSEAFTSVTIDDTQFSCCLILNHSRHANILMMIADQYQWRHAPRGGGNGGAV